MTEPTDYESLVQAVAQRLQTFGVGLDEGALGYLGDRIQKGLFVAAQDGRSGETSNIVGALSSRLEHEIGSLIQVESDELDEGILASNEQPTLGYNEMRELFTSRLCPGFWPFC